MYVIKVNVKESGMVMRDFVDRYVGLIEASSKEHYYDESREFLLNNNLYSKDSIQVLIDELNSRVEAKEKAATVLGSVLLPVAFGFLVYLLENETINSIPTYFAIALLLMFLLMCIVMGVAHCLVGKKGLVWKTRSVISVLHQLQLETLSNTLNSEEKR